MNKNINSIPAYVSNFEEQENGNTKAKLKVFYVGETVDGRIFDEKFSRTLSDTIIGSPVVGYYSTVKEDFLGHNSKQYVYGYVNALDGFEEDEEGVKWLTAEVTLFTNRGDNISEVANKIVGHPQSLELDPNKTKYEVVSENGEAKIHFTEGAIIGLSVLGTEQKPAFEGSMFFEENKKLKELKNFKKRCDYFFSVKKEEIEKRGKEMDEKKKTFSIISDFYALNYEEKTSLVAKALQAEYGEQYGLYIAQIDDNICVAEVLDYNTWQTSYKRVDYKIDENNSITFGKSVDVVARYLTPEEIDALPKPTPNSVFTEKKVEEKTDKKEDNFKAKEGKNDEEHKEQPKEDKQVFSAPSASALSNSEKEELEAFRNAKKISIIDSYKGDLEESVLKDYKAKIKDFSADELEVKLAVSFRKAVEKQKEKNKEPNTTVVFRAGYDLNNICASNNDGNKEINNNSYESLVDLYKD